jgi:hypothetical protein
MSWKVSTPWLVIAALCGLQAGASAQTRAAAPVRENGPTVTRGPQPGFAYGSEVALGGGVMNFTGGTARAMTGVGGSWNVRLGIGTRSIIGAELAYLGSAQSISAAGLDPDAVLLGNGAEAVLRLNAPIPMQYGGGVVEPFILGGIGWNHYSVVNDDFNTSMVKENDSVGMVPLGAGLAASYAGFVADARFTYRLAFDEALIGSSKLHSWALTANVGREF